MTELKFPEKLIFGAATSAYQIEGAVDNDWVAWERAQRLKVKDVYCGDGIDHLSRWREDLGLLFELGAQAYRYSVEWSRIEPRPGEFDDDALWHYVRIAEALRARGVLPVVTLHHFTHPRWFHEKTPWESPASVDAFARFARRVVSAIGAVPAYVTLNEPNVVLNGGFLAAAIPPGRADLKAMGKACANMIRAHAAAHAVIRELAPTARIGLAHNVLHFAPARPYFPPDRLLVRVAHRMWNDAIPDAIAHGELEMHIPFVYRHRERIPEAKGTLDFLGLNYYTRVHLALKLLAKVPCELRYLDTTRKGLTDIGWEDYPEGLYRHLKDFARYGLPIWITENGIDDRAGNRRSQFLYEHLHAMLRAMAEGVNVEAYLHWSLLDNFEWLEGYGPRFGLYHVDFQTRVRTATPAANYLRRLIQARRLLEPGAVLGPPAVAAASP